MYVWRVFVCEGVFVCYVCVCLCGMLGVHLCVCVCGVCVCTRVVCACVWCVCMQRSIISFGDFFSPNAMTLNSFQQRKETQSRAVAETAP